MLLGRRRSEIAGYDLPWAAHFHQVAHCERAHIGWLVVETFSQALDHVAELPENSHTTTEGHGHKETRKTIVLDAPQFADRAAWKGLASLIMDHRTSIDAKENQRTIHRRA